MKKKYEELIGKSKKQSVNFYKNCSIIADEMNQRELKKNNLVIFGLPERVDGSVSDRRQNDMMKCAELFEALGCSNAAIEKATRLGKERSDNKRLLRVTLSNTKDKYELLKQSRILRRHAKFNGVYLQPDLTFAQRQADFDLRRELRDRRGKGENVIIHKGKIVERKSVVDFHKEF